MKIKTVYRAVELKAPGIIERASVKEAVITGWRDIDKKAITIDTIVIALFLIFFRVYYLKVVQFKIELK